MPYHKTRSFNNQLSSLKLICLCIFPVLWKQSNSPSRKKILIAFLKGRQQQKLMWQSYKLNRDVYKKTNLQVKLQKMRKSPKNKLQSYLRIWQEQKKSRLNPSKSIHKTKQKLHLIVVNSMIMSTGTLSKNRHVQSKKNSLPLYCLKETKISKAVNLKQENLLNPQVYHRMKILL